MPLVIRLRSEPLVPVEVASVRMEDVVKQSADQIRRTPVLHGNRTVELGELFDVSGSAAQDATIVWQGDCSRVNRIGEGLTAGRVRIEGHAGKHVGAQMAGGEMLIEGDAGDWLGAEMRGGRLRVRGRAGDCVGAVYRGGVSGMSGGEILIDGDAGDELGRGMRRGVIAVRGRTGEAAGSGMRAGSLFLFGPVGRRIGAGMRRGSIVLFERNPEVLPTFQWACRHRPVFLRVYLKHLAENGFDVPRGCFQAPYDRYSGDFLEGGRGELLIRSEEDG